MNGAGRDPVGGDDGVAMLQHLGARMTDWREDFAQLQLPFRAHLMNRQGLPHGGVYATLLDSAMGFAGCFDSDPARPRLALTLTLTVNYLAQPRGTVLIAEAWRTGGGRRSFFADGRVVDEIGTSVASGSGVFRYRGDA